MAALSVQYASGAMAASGNAARSSEFRDFRSAHRGDSLKDRADLRSSDGALQKSLGLRPDGNDAALAGLGALANARHEFARLDGVLCRSAALGPTLQRFPIEEGDPSRFRFSGNQSQAARLLRITRDRMRYKMAKYDLK